MTEKKLKPVKLEDISKKLGVSKVTVSKALRNHPDISEATKLKVKALAEKMGYLPNFMAKNLSSRKSNTIGLVVPKIAHFFFGSVIESVYDTAFENHYETVITVSQESAERERKHILSLLSMRVDGLIISITQETRDMSIFERALKLNVPIVFMDRVPAIKNVASVTVDDKSGAYNAVEQFINKGITKIGHIGGYPHINIGRARYDGYIKALKDYNIPVNDNWISIGGFGEEDGYNGFNKMISSGDLPEAIFAATYPIALGIYEAGLEHGISIPKDLKITCFGNNTYKRSIPSAFNFVIQPAEELGRESVNLLIKLINNPKEYKSMNIQLKTEIMINGNEKPYQLVI